MTPIKHRLRYTLSRARGFVSAKLMDRRPRAMHLLYRNPLEHDRLADSGRFHLRETVTGWRRKRGSDINIYQVGEAVEPPSVGRAAA